MTSVWTELQVYFGRFRQFSTRDWVVYLAWVGLMLGLMASTGSFLAIGVQNGAVFPSEAFMVPFGAGIFALAISVDTIGHRTVYKEALKGGEALVHHIIVFSGIGACVLLCAAYPARPGFAIPAMVLTVLSFVYSLVDEVMHWRRYLSQKSDVVEMWSHVFILVGHGIMMVGWWRWYLLGYAGVARTLQAMGFA